MQQRKRAKSATSLERIIIVYNYIRPSNVALDESADAISPLIEKFGTASTIMSMYYMFPLKAVATAVEQQNGGLSCCVTWSEHFLRFSLETLENAKSVQYITVVLRLVAGVTDGRGQTDTAIRKPYKLLNLLMLCANAN